MDNRKLDNNVNL